MGKGELDAWEIYGWMMTRKVIMYAWMDEKISDGGTDE